MPIRITPHGGAALAGAGLTLLALPGLALAGPTQTLAIAPNGTIAQIGGVTADPGANTLRATAATAAGDQAGVRYCLPWRNSRLHSVTTETARWHATPKIGRLKLIADGRELWAETDQWLTYREPTTTREAHIASPGARCVTLGFFASGTNAVTGLWTARLASALVEDLEGPSVTTPSVPDSWVTGSTAPISFSSSDNGLGEERPSLAIGELELPVASGSVRLDAPVGHLVDGTHRVTISRSGTGWRQAHAAALIRVDRTPPRPPVASGAPALWVNEPVVVRADPTADGNGSGWRRNLVRTADGVVDLGEGIRIAREGTTALELIAEDRAGHRSTPTGAKVRIDLSAPKASLRVGSRRADGRVPIDIALSDQLSGIARWELRDDRDRRRAGGHGPVNSRHLLDASIEGRLTLAVHDRAGNITRVQGPRIAPARKSGAPATSTPPKVTKRRPSAPPHPTKLGVPARGRAGARYAAGVALPFWTVHVPGVGRRRIYAIDGAKIDLRVVGQIRTGRTARGVAPVVGAGRNRRRAIVGKVRADGRPLGHALLVVRRPGGAFERLVTTDARGNFRFAASRLGLWTVTVWGRPTRTLLIVVDRTTRLRAAFSARSIEAGDRLIVRGAITPRSVGARRLVQLQWRDTDRWRPIVNSRAGRTGAFRLAYRFTRRGGYRVTLRVVALGRPGQRSLRTRSHVIEVLP